MTTIFRHLALAVLLVPGAASAQPFQNLDTIDLTARVATGLATRPVDRRLKLAACPEPPTAELASNGTVAVVCPVIGWRIRIIIEGSAAKPTTGAIIIRRGDPVSINFSASGFSVTTSGIAESDARMGERVRVRVAQKADPVTGEATDVGTVRVRALN